MNIIISVKHVYLDIEKNGKEPKKETNKTSVKFANISFKLLEILSSPF